jgi:hypothetical protein
MRAWRLGWVGFFGAGCAVPVAAPPPDGSDLPEDGRRAVEGIDAPPRAPLQIDDLGLVPYGTEVTFRAHPDAVSLTLVVAATDANEHPIRLDPLLSPGKQVLVSAADPWGSPVRTAFDPRVVIAQIPNAPPLTVETGTYTVLVDRDQPGAAQVTLVHKLALPPEPARLDLTYWFVGAGGLGAPVAQTDSGFQALHQALGDRLASYGVAFGEVAYRDLPAERAEPFRVLEPERELGELLASIDAEDRTVSLVLVGGFETAVAGRSGGVPGTVLHGTAASGLAVSLTDYLALGPTEWVIAGFVRTTTHELGHYLGLFHTTEPEGDRHDPLDDTPQCTKDWDGDGLVSAEDCPGLGAENLMFWEGPTGEGELTPQQHWVIRRHPALD